MGEDLNIDDMTKAQLQELAKKMDVPHTGTKDEILSRIRDFAIEEILEGDEDDEDTSSAPQDMTVIGHLMAAKEIINNIAEQPGKTPMNIKRQLFAIDAAIREF